MDSFHSTNDVNDDTILSSALNDTRGRKKWGKEQTTNKKVTQSDMKSKFLQNCITPKQDRDEIKKQDFKNVLFDIKPCGDSSFSTAERRESNEYMASPKLKSNNSMIKDIDDDDEDPILKLL